MQTQDQKAKIFEFLEKFKNNQTSQEDIFKFITDLVASMPSVEGEAPTVKIAPLEERTQAKYVPNSNEILIGKDYIERIQNGKSSFCELLDTIAHEHRHYMQIYMMSKLQEIDAQNGQNQEYYDSLARSLTQQRYEEKDIDQVVSVLGEHSNNAYFNAFNNFLPKDRARNIHLLEHSMYLENKMEADARLAGYNFAGSTLRDLANDPMCSEEMREYLRSFKPDLENLKTDLQSYEKNYRYVAKFEENLAKIPQEVLLDIENSIKGYEKQMVDIMFDMNLTPKQSESKEKQLTDEKLVKIAVISRVMDAMLKNKSYEDIQSLYFEQLKFGLTYAPDEITHFIISNHTVPGEEKDKFKSNAYIFLLNEEYPSDVFKTTIMALLDKNQKEDVYKHLSKQNKLEHLSQLKNELFGSTNTKSDFLRNYDLIMPLAQQMNYALEHNKETNAKDYTFLMSLLQELKVSFDNVKGQLNLEQNPELIGTTLDDLINDLDNYKEQVEQLTQNQEQDFKQENIQEEISEYRNDGEEMEI